MVSQPSTTSLASAAPRSSDHWSCSERDPTAGTPAGWPPPDRRVRWQPRGRSPGVDDAVREPDRSASTPSTPRPVRTRSRARATGRSVAPTGWCHRRSMARPIGGSRRRTSSRSAAREGRPSTPTRSAGDRMALDRRDDGLVEESRVGPSDRASRRSRRAFSSRRCCPCRSRWPSDRLPQNVPEPPVSTATDTASSRSKSTKMSYSNCAVGPSTALRAAGRSMVTTRTAPGLRHARSCRQASHAPLVPFASELGGPGPQNSDTNGMGGWEVGSGRR